MPHYRSKRAGEWSPILARDSHPIYRALTYIAVPLLGPQYNESTLYTVLVPCHLWLLCLSKAEELYTSLCFSFKENMFNNSWDSMWKKTIIFLLFIWIISSSICYGHEIFWGPRGCFDLTVLSYQNTNSSAISLPYQTIWTRERPNFKSLKSHISWYNYIWSDAYHPGVVEFSS